MTRFAEPEKVACPHCEALFLRPVLLSYNSAYQVVYSDGGSINGIQNAIQTEGRCVHCQHIITDIQNLNTLEQNPTFGLTTLVKSIVKGFKKQSVLKRADYQFLPKPTFDDFIELFYDNNETDKKREWALKAIRTYHQAFCLQLIDNRNVGKKSMNLGQPLTPSSLQQSEYFNACNFILTHRPMKIVDEYFLICADIYRLRGEFARAINEYAQVQSRNLFGIVDQGKLWCTQRNQFLMVLDI